MAIFGYNCSYFSSINYIFQEDFIMEKRRENWESIAKEDKEILFALIGKAFTTGKRQAIPKAVYDHLTKDQRVAARYILDLAQECFEK